MDAPEEAWRREYTRRCKRREIVVRVSRAKAETSRRPKIEEAVKNVGGESVLRP